MFNYTEMKTGPTQANRNYSNRNMNRPNYRNANSNNRSGNVPRNPFENEPGNHFTQNISSNDASSGMMIGGSKVNVAARGPNPHVPSSQ